MKGYAWINRWRERGTRMDFDFTEYEYLPECKDGCGAITTWLYSKESANDAGRNHQREKGHEYKVRERMK